MQTSTGLKTDQFRRLADRLAVVIMLATFIGGCAARAAAESRCMRWVLVGKQASREFKRLVHPSGEFAVKLRGKARASA
jgi:trk system potassium uptake protein TrkH